MTSDQDGAAPEQPERADRAEKADQPDQPEQVRRLARIEGEIGTVREQLAAERRRLGTVRRVTDALPAVTELLRRHPEAATAAELLARGGADCASLGLDAEDLPTLEEVLALGGS